MPQKTSKTPDSQPTDIRVIEASRDVGTSQASAEKQENAQHTRENIEDSGSGMDRGTPPLIYEDTFSVLNKKVTDGTKLSYASPPGVGEVAVGWVKLAVPPERITVTDGRTTQSIAGLRTNTEALIKTGRGEAQIVLDVRFPSMDAINTQLREIIAIFRTTPFITLNSTHIADILKRRWIRDMDDTRIEDIDRSTKQAREQMKGMTPELDRWYKRRDKSKCPHYDTLKLLLFDVARGTEKVNMRTLRRVKLLMTGVYKELEPETAQDRQQLIDVLTGLHALAVSAQKNEMLKLSLKTLRSAEESDVIPVVFSTIEYQPDTDPNGGTIPNAIRARLTFLLFNFSPTSYDYSFKNILGMPTPDIAACPSLHKHVYDRFLKGDHAHDTFGSGRLAPDTFATSGDHPHGKYQEMFGSMVGFRFPTTRLERTAIREVDDTRLNPMRDVHTNANGILFPANFTVPVVERPGASYINMYEDLVFTGEDGMVERGMVVRLQNRLAKQPIQGAMYPSYQFLGGANASLSLTLDVVGAGLDKENAYRQLLSKLQYMKAESDSVSLRNTRMRRHHKIFFAHNLAAIAGIYAVQIDNFAVVSPPRGREGGPNQSTVVLNMVEFRISQEARELVLSAKAASKREMVMALKYALKQYRSHRWLSQKHRLEAESPAYRTLQALRDIGDRGTLHDDLRVLLFGQIEEGRSEDVAAKIASMEPRWTRSDPYWHEGKPEPLRDWWNAATQTGASFRLPTASFFAKDMHVMHMIRKYDEGGTYGGVNYGQFLGMCYGADTPDDFGRRVVSTDTDKTILSSLRISDDNKRALRALYWTNDAVDFEARVRSLQGVTSTLSTMESISTEGVFCVAAVMSTIDTNPDLRDSIDTNMLGMDVNGTRWFNDLWPVVNKQTRLTTRDTVNALVDFLRKGSYVTDANDVQVRSPLIEAFQKCVPPVLTEGTAYGDDVSIPVPSDAFAEMYIDYITRSTHESDPVLSSRRQSDVAARRLDADDDLRARLLILSKWLTFYDQDYLVKMESMRSTESGRCGYPDLNLPTYEEAFPTVITAIRKTYDGGAGRSGTYGINYGAEKLPSDVVQWLSRFIPTYKDLGLRPPAGRSMHDLARSPKDVVEPDFFWHHYRLVGPLEQPREVLMQELRRTPTRGTLPVGEYESNNIGEGKQAALDRTTTGMDFMKAAGSDNTRGFALRGVKYTTDDFSRDSVPSGKDLQSCPNLLASKGTPINQDYVSRGLSNDWAYSQENNSALVDYVLDSQIDDRFRMANCYPTFQIYFIEEDAENWTLLDDVFGYTAVVELRVQKNKYRPSVADLTLINVSGNLGQDSATKVAAKKFKYTDPGWKMKLAANVYGLLDDNMNTMETIMENQGRPEDEFKRALGAHKRGAEGSQLVEEYTGEEEDPGYFPIGVGTMIAIRMGYSSKVSDMEIVFTGQVAEFTQGDVIRIVAQDYTTQLTVPLNDKGIRKGIINNNPDAPGVIETILDASPSHHFGTTDMYSLISHLYGATSSGVTEIKTMRDGALQVKHLPGEAPTGIASKILGSIATVVGKGEKGKWTRKMENVFFPRESALYRYFALDPWVVPHKIGLESLHELARHHPGWVMAARPYDLNGMTLFFGKPSQPYYYTAWHPVHKDAVQTMESAEQPEDLISGLMDDFMESSHGKHLTFRLYHYWYTDATPGSVTDGYRDCVDNIVKRLSGVSEEVFCGGSTADLKFLMDVLGSDAVKELARRLFDFDFITDEGMPKGTEEFFRMPGTALTALPTWENVLYMLTTTHDKGSKQESTIGGRLLGEVPHDYTSPDGVPVTREQWTKVVPVILKMRGVWQSFAALMHAYVLERALKDGDILKFVASHAAAATRCRLPARMRPFRMYHTADSSSNILHNGIYASAKNVDNCIIVEYPDKVGEDVTESMQNVGGHTVKVVQFSNVSSMNQFHLPLSLHIPKRERKVRAVVEMNAGGIDKAELCAYSNLADAVRPMYRGELIIRGNAGINPWDVVHVSDAYNDMSGPVEVETVTHHFTQEFGFVTSVVPNLFVSPNDDTDWLVCKAYGFLAGLGAVAGLATAALATTVPYVGIPLAGLTLLATYLLGDDVSEHLTGTSMLGLVKGKGIFAGRVHPIDIMPLTVAGVPYVVGLEKNIRLTFAMHWAGQWVDIQKRYEAAMAMVDKLSANRPLTSGG